MTAVDDATGDPVGAGRVLLQPLKPSGEPEEKAFAYEMKAGGLVRPEQFTAVDAETFVITLDRPSKLTLPDLAVPVPFIINSEVAKANATADDPWAMEYLHKNPAGSGAALRPRGPRR